MAERESSSHDDDDDVGYLDFEHLARYSSLSVSTLRRYVNDPVDPLPHLRLRGAGKAKGRVLVDKRAFDQWIHRRFGAPAAATPAAPDLSWGRRSFGR